MRREAFKLARQREHELRALGETTTHGSPFLVFSPRVPAQAAIACSWRDGRPPQQRRWRSLHADRPRRLQLARFD